MSTVRKFIHCMQRAFLWRINFKLSSERATNLTVLYLVSVGTTLVNGGDNAC